MAAHNRSIQALVAIGVLFLLTACSGDSLGLGPDAVNSSTPGFGSSLGATLNDSFSYNAENPTLNLPVQVYAEKAGYHGDAGATTTSTSSSTAEGSVERLSRNRQTSPSPTRFPITSASFTRVR